MTLDIKKLLVNIIKKQMQIQHFDVDVNVFKPESLPENVTSKIASEFGEDYLNDANMIIFFKGAFDEESAEKLFSVVNKALGEDANRMTEGDFKQFSFSNDAADADQTNNDQNKNTDDETPDHEIAEIVNDKDDSESSTDDEQDEEDEEDEVVDNKVDEIVNNDNINEDDEEEEKKIDQNENIQNIKKTYIFLKITTK